MQVLSLGEKAPLGANKAQTEDFREHGHASAARQKAVSGQAKACKGCDVTVVGRWCRLACVPGALRENKSLEIRGQEPPSGEVQGCIVANETEPLQAGKTATSSHTVPSNFASDASERTHDPRESASPSPATSHGCSARHRTGRKAYIPLSHMKLAKVVKWPQRVWEVMDDTHWRALLFAPGKETWRREYRALAAVEVVFGAATSNVLEAIKRFSEDRKSHCPPEAGHSKLGETALSAFVTFLTPTNGDAAGPAQLGVGTPHGTHVF